MFEASWLISFRFHTLATVATVNLAAFKADDQLNVALISEDRLVCPCIKSTFCQRARGIGLCSEQ